MAPVDVIGQGSLDFGSIEKRVEVMLDTPTTDRRATGSEVRDYGRTTVTS